MLRKVVAHNCCAGQGQFRLLVRIAFLAGVARHHGKTVGVLLQISAGVVQYFAILDLGSFRLLEQLRAAIAQALLRSRGGQLVNRIPCQLGVVLVPALLEESTQ